MYVDATLNNRAIVVSPRVVHWATFNAENRREYPMLLDDL
jgi:hypothetical protein